ncbi:MAG: lytic transglycosylase domain-containing protein [Rhodobacteraceae bacterium]|nr:lytic transglycosylase domain-containing protein [Paracoccaceae bacterium]
MPPNPNLPPNLTRRTALVLSLAALAACGRRRRAWRGSRLGTSDTPLHPNETPELRALIEEYAALYDVPVDLVHRVVIRESTHRPDARNGPYYGLMQILPETARTMGHRGPASQLLDAETNLKYAVKYLRGAWIVSGGDRDDAVMWYARGYYYEAKRLGLLQETGLRG